MASLKKIHTLSTELQTNFIETVPSWISGRKLYDISGPDNSALGCHFSGLLRQVGNMVDDGDEYVFVKDENGNTYDLAVLLHEAAERMDDAHEEWLEQRVEALRRLNYA